MADWCNDITLIQTETGATNENGFESEPQEVSRRTVFCNEKSIGNGEFYKAQAAGITASLKCDVHIADYGGELLAEYNGIRYSILKTYKLDDDTVELTLSDLRQQAKDV